MENKAKNQRDIDGLVSELDRRADDWEIYLERYSIASGIIEKGKIKGIKREDEETAAIRVIVNGKVGFASGRISESLVEAAIKVARISEERMGEFPSERVRNYADGIFDSYLKTPSASHVREALTLIINSCLETGANPAFGAVELAWVERSVLNSSGIHVSEEETYSSGFIEAVYRESSAYEMDETRYFDTTDFEFIGRRAGELAKMADERVKPDSGSYELVLSPIATQQLLNFSLYPAFRADNVARKRSILAGKIGEEIFGELTVYDDGKLSYGLNTVSFDDEGVETQTTALVDEGVLESYITDFRFAAELGVEVTGNGFREEITEYPQPSPTNVVLIHPEVGEWSESCLYVHSLIGAHTSNPVSGDFSVEINVGFIDGKGVRGGMIYGNVYELLREIEYIAEDIRQIENTITGSVCFGKVKIKF
jgi:PmbA protein